MLRHLELALLFHWLKQVMPGVSRTVGGLLHYQGQWVFGRRAPRSGRARSQGRRFPQPACPSGHRTAPPELVSGVHL